MMRSLRVERHVSEAGSWELAHGDPEPRLAAHVGRYCSYVERLDRPLRRRELPFARAVLVVSLGPTIEIRGAAGPAQVHSSFVAGIDDGPTITEHGGVQHGVQVDLTPLGAFQVLGLPMSELARRTVALDDLLGGAASELAERLHDAPGWEERFTILDTALAARAARHRPASPDVAWAWRRLRETVGRLPIRVLTEELGCSHRHLSTRFREQVGMSPKAVARVLRFERAVDRLRRGGRSLAEIARDCGYYDQAHMNRDVRMLAGTTPSALASP
jgi:AraC-like DNA-binding protein